MGQAFWIPLVVLAALAVLYSLGVPARSIWFDEAYTLHTLAGLKPVAIPVGLVEASALKPYVTGIDSPVGVVTQLINHDVHPPFYFLLANAWAALFGNTIEAVRMLSVVFALAAVYGFWRLVEAHGVRPALPYALVFGLSFGLVTSAHEARYGALVILLALAALWLSARRPANEAPDWRGQVALGAVCTALLYSFYFTAFVVAPLLALPALRFLRTRNPVHAIAPVMATLLFLPWLPVVIQHMGARPDQANGFVGLVEWVRILTLVSTDSLFERTTPDYPRLIGLVASLIVFAGLVTGGLIVLRGLAGGPAAPRPLWISVWTVGCGYLLYTGLLIATDKSLASIRHFIHFLPFLAVIATYGLASLGGALAARLAGPDGSRTAALASVPVLLLGGIQLTSSQFGHEVTHKRLGSHFKSLSADLEATGIDYGLVIADSGVEIGDILVTGAALPDKAAVFVLDPRTEAWRDQVSLALPAALEGRNTVWLRRARNRPGGSPALYAPVAEALQAAGFRETEPWTDRWEHRYAVWSRDLPPPAQPSSR